MPFGTNEIIQSTQTDIQLPGKGKFIKMDKINENQYKKIVRYLWFEYPAEVWKKLFIVHSDHIKWKSQILPFGTNEITQRSQKDIPLPVKASGGLGDARMPNISQAPSCN